MYLDSWSSLSPHDLRFFSLSQTCLCCSFISGMTCIFLLLNITSTKLNWEELLILEKEVSAVPTEDNSHWQKLNFQLHVL